MRAVPMCIALRSLAHHYEGRLRSHAHYSKGWLPVWAGAATPHAVLTRVVKAVSTTPALSHLVERAGDFAEQRDVPVFAEQRFVDWFRSRPTTDRRRPAWISTGQLATAQREPGYAGPAAARPHPGRGARTELRRGIPLRPVTRGRQGFRDRLGRQ